MANLNDVDKDGTIDQDDLYVPGEVDLIKLVIDRPQAAAAVDLLEEEGARYVTLGFLTSLDFRVWKNSTKGAFEDDPDGEETRSEFYVSGPNAVEFPLTLWLEGRESGAVQISLGYRTGHEYLKATFQHYSALVVEGEGWTFRTEADDTLARMGYACEVLSRPTENEVLSRIPNKIVFVFNGHGNSGEIVIDYYGDIRLTPADILAANGSDNPYRLAYLNSCNSAADGSGKYWKAAFKAKSFVGWATLVGELKANSFDWRFCGYVEDGMYTGAAVVQVMIDMGLEYGVEPYPLANGSTKL